MLDEAGTAGEDPAPPPPPFAGVDGEEAQGDEWVSGVAGLDPPGAPGLRRAEVEGSSRIGVPNEGVAAWKLLLETEEGMDGESTFMPSASPEGPLRPDSWLRRASP